MPFNISWDWSFLVSILLGGNPKSFYFINLCFFIITSVSSVSPWHKIFFVYFPLLLYVVSDNAADLILAFLCHNIAAVGSCSSCPWRSRQTTGSVKLLMLPQKVKTLNYPN